MTNRVFMLPLWIRLWHWSNALAIIVLSITGISLHFSDPGLPLVEFSLAARIHNIAGVCLAGALCRIRDRQHRHRQLVAIRAQAARHHPALPAPDAVLWFGHLQG
jgi:hydrogenase/urease accessory protein HupE